MIIQSAFGDIIRDSLRKVWKEEAKEMLMLEFFMSHVDLGKPIFALQDIKYIPRWKTLLLKLLPTKKVIDKDSTLYFKFWRGTVYLVKVEDS